MPDYIGVWRDGRPSVLPYSELSFAFDDLRTVLGEFRRWSIDHGGEEHPEIGSRLYSRIDVIEELLGLPPYDWTEASMRAERADPEGFERSLRGEASDASDA